MDSQVLLPCSWIEAALRYATKSSGAHLSGEAEGFRLEGERWKREQVKKGRLAGSTTAAYSYLKRQLQS